MADRILLADDSITIQKVVGLTFASENYQLDVVDNGDEAFSSISSNPPDLVLADTDMPGLNGFELCRKIKESNPDLPVILLYNTYEVFDSDQAEEVGADFWSPKPFDADTLMLKIRELLSSTGSAEEEPVEEIAEDMDEPEEISTYDDLGEGEIVTGFDAVDDGELSEETVADVEDDGTGEELEEALEPAEDNQTEQPSTETSEVTSGADDVPVPVDDASVADMEDRVVEEAPVTEASSDSTAGDDPWSLDGVDVYGADADSDLTSATDDGEELSEELPVDEGATLEADAAMDHAEEITLPEEAENIVDTEEVSDVSAPDFEESMLDFGDVDPEAPLQDQITQEATELLEDALETVEEQDVDDKEEAAAVDIEENLLATEPETEPGEEDIAGVEELTQPDTDDDDVFEAEDADDMDEVDESAASSGTDEIADFEAVDEVVESPESATDDDTAGEDSVDEIEESTEVEVQDEMAAFEAMAASGALDETEDDTALPSDDEDRETDAGDAMMEEFESFVQATGDEPTRTPEPEDDILNDLAAFEGESVPSDADQAKADLPSDEPVQEETESLQTEEDALPDPEEEQAPLPAVHTAIDSDALAEQVETTVRHVIDQVIAEKLEEAVRDSLSAAVEKVTREILDKLRS